MNCKTCNTPAPGFELRDGLCVNCLHAVYAVAVKREIALLATIERLRHFANHLPNCMVNHRGMSCDCGYDEVKEGRSLAREQPCGCIVCMCDHPTQCQGCGAKHCGTHLAGYIPNPVYVGEK